MSEDLGFPYRQKILQDFLKTHNFDVQEIMQALYIKEQLLFTQNLNRICRRYIQQAILSPLLDIELENLGITKVVACTVWKIKDGLDGMNTLSVEFNVSNIINGNVQAPYLRGQAKIPMRYVEDEKLLLAWRDATPNWRKIGSRGL